MDLARGFLLVGWLALSGPAAAADIRTEIVVQSSLAAGLAHHEAKAVWDQLKIGDPLVLVRERDNAHDPNAVRVDWKGYTLGYLPRSENEAVARQLDRGNRLEARITSIGQHLNHRRKLGVEIFLRI